MLSMEDCIALSELTEAEIDIIRSHEHLTTMAAIEYGNWLLHLPSGERRIAALIRHEIDRARDASDVARVALLKLVLHRFLAEHGVALPLPKRIGDHLE